MVPIVGAMYSAIIQEVRTGSVKQGFYIVERVHPHSVGLDNSEALFDDTPPIRVDVRWMFTRAQVGQLGFSVSRVPNIDFHVLDSNHRQRGFVWTVYHVHVAYGVYGTDNDPKMNIITIVGVVNIEARTLELYWSPLEMAGRRILTELVSDKWVRRFLDEGKFPTRTSPVTPQVMVCHGCGMIETVDTGIYFGEEQLLYGSACWRRIEFAWNVYDQLRRRCGDTPELAALVAEHRHATPTNA